MVAQLLAGDEAAFRALVAEYDGRLARLARAFCRNDAVIQDAVQETWLAVIRGLRGFEGRSTLRAWIFGILVNQARRLGVREHRHAKFAAGTQQAPSSDHDPNAPEPREPGMGVRGMWAEPPMPWGLADPESTLLARETLSVVEAAISALPELQRQVVLLRDVEGLDAEAACKVLGCTDTHQRVLLHRGRARVRQALDLYLKTGRRTP